jgi:hypothetical protein
MYKHIEMPNFGLNIKYTVRTLEELNINRHKHLKNLFYKNIEMLKFGLQIEYTVRSLRELYKNLTGTLKEPYKNLK